MNTMPATARKKGHAMPRASILPACDPLAKYKDGAVDASGAPVPLVSTAIAVKIDGGIAVVATERVFKNAEKDSIEATITFPVPVHAVLTGLTARIDGRVVSAAAQRKAKARQTYEQAIDSGKTAVLHEEAIRGVHIVSVGHVPPGKEVSVTSTWAIPLSRHGADAATALLRIPTTVGDIYGRSPLSDADDLVTSADAVHEATLEVSCDNGAAHLVGGGLVDGKAKLRLDAPVDIVVTGWSAKTLEGVAADGRKVRLTVSPAAAGEAALNAEILADYSGSMGSRAEGGRESRSKHEVLKDGLRAVAAALRPEDRVRLWEFDNSARLVSAPTFAQAVERLSSPNGGTEIGVALAQATNGSEASDVLLVTDGMSHALDVHGFARSGKRISVVLIGEGALEANVGHLAALTGGQLFVVSGSDAADAVRAAVASMRVPHARPAPIEGAPAELAARIGGMVVEAAWGGEAPEGAAADPVARQVAAVAAALAIPRLGEESAADLAVAEGIVCHLTSLVLVDEEGEAQEGIPAQRKVALMAPRTSHAALRGFAAKSAPGGAVAFAASACLSGGASWRGGAESTKMMLSAGPSRGLSRGLVNMGPESSALGAFDDMFCLDEGGSGDAAPPSGLVAAFRAASSNLASVRGRIDWTAAPDALRRGDLSGVDASVAAVIRAAAAEKAVADLAASLGADAVAVAVSLLAESEGADRSAARIARAVLGKADAAKLAAARAAVGL
jgi:hypothetical protein